MLLTIDIAEKKKTYPIRISHNSLTSFLEKFTNRKVLLVSNEKVFPIYEDKCRSFLGQKGHHLYLMPDGEEYKNWQEAEKILNYLLEENFARNDLILAFGGGVVGDLAGFVASIYKRGMGFIQIPTSLLAQVDSSVGGKVAINHPKGKNMLGSFYQPEEVLIDSKLLESLEKREFNAGLAEVIKYGLIGDADFFNYLYQERSELKRDRKDFLEKIIYQSCLMKKKIVEQDEKDFGLRNILNFGHTLGHSLENITGYKKYLHGEALSVGIVFASRLSLKLGKISRDDFLKIKDFLAYLSLPVSLDKNLDRKEIYSLFFKDKKNLEGRLRFVLLERLGRAELVDDLEEDFLLETLKECQR